MLNGIVEKGFSVKHKVSREKFLDITSDKLIDKFNDVIKEKSKKLLMLDCTHDLMNDIKTLHSEKQILWKFSAEVPSKSLAFCLIIICKNNLFGETVNRHKLY